MFAVSLIKRTVQICFAATLLLTTQVHGELLPQRQAAATIDDLLKDKMINWLPHLMEREGIDMWVLISREYNEDPVLKTMLPSSWISARRRTMLVIYNPGDGKPLERLAVARYGVADLFEKAWDKEAQPDQWKALRDIIHARNPKTIGINQSRDFALADGIVATELTQLKDALGPELATRIVSAQTLAIAWLETRTEKEMRHYPDLIEAGHNVIAEVFSDASVVPGQTTTDDLVWLLREKAQDLGLGVWFHPTVSLQRSNTELFEQTAAFSARPEGQVIQPGDLLHLDFGMTYLRLNSDQQQHAYVLKPGETDAPDSLKQALKNGNRLQDIFTGLFAVGKTGNQILKEAREQAIEEGITPSIYSHPIGYHGHGAGTTLGMWDSQGGVPVKGDYPLQVNTAYSIELNAATFIPQWNKEIRIMLEEEAFFDGSTVEYMDGRQTQFHLIGGQGQ